MPRGSYGSSTRVRPSRADDLSSWTAVGAMSCCQLAVSDEALVQQYTGQVCRSELGHPPVLEDAEGLPQPRRKSVVPCHQCYVCPRTGVGAAVPPVDQVHQRYRQRRELVFSSLTRELPREDQQPPICREYTCQKQLDPI